MMQWCRVLLVIFLVSIVMLLADVNKAFSAETFIFSSDQEALGWLDPVKSLTDKQLESTILKGHSNDVFEVVFSPDSRLLASGSKDATVRLWEVSTGRHMSTLKGHKASAGFVAFSPDGRLLASGSWDRTVRLWEVSTGSHVSTLTGHTDNVNGVAFSPDGSLLASGSADKTVRLWKAPSGNHISTLSGHEQSINRVAFSPDGSLLASSSYDKTVRLWEMPGGRHMSTLEHLDPVHGVAFSPDGRLLASGSMDGIVHFWEVSTGNRVSTLRGHTNGVHSVAFSPDGSLLASGNADATIRFWEVSTGNHISTLRGHIGVNEFVAFSPDGRLFASGSSDETICLWGPLPASTFSVAGETIDWSSGKSIGPPYAVAIFETPADPYQIGLTVRNEGHGTLYQLRAETHSNRAGFNKLPLLFGKIEPKQSKTRYLPIPRREIAEGGAVNLRFNWMELNNNTPAALSTEIELLDLPKPNLVTSFRVIDGGSGLSVGNKDGVLQPGEAVNLILSVKNAGDMPAQDVAVVFTLPDDPSLRVYGQRSVSLGEISAGDVKDAELTVQVNRGTELENISIRLDIEEASFKIAKVIVERIPFANLGPNLQTFVPRTMYVKADRAALLSEANVRASIVGHGSRGTELRVTGRSGDFYRLELEAGAIAWIPISEVSKSTIQSPSQIQKPPALEAFPGPAIVVTAPKDQSTTVNEQVMIAGGVRAIGQSFIEKVYVMVNGAAQVAIKAKTKPSDVQLFNLQHTLALQPGQNIIEIVAADNRGLTSKERLAVLREEDKTRLAAVVIGIERYQHIRQLRFARDDAEAVFTYLTTKLGVPVDRAQYLYDGEANLKAIRTALGKWLRDISGPNDTVIIYYSGHGAVEVDPSSRDGDSLSKYLLPVGAEANNLYGTAFPMEEVKTLFKRIRAKRLIFIVDACYSGGAGGRTIPRPEDAKDLHLSSRFLDELTKGEGRVILTASGPNELAQEDSRLGHGVFTYHFLQALNEQAGKADSDQDGYITLREVFTYVSEKVSKATNQKQRPLFKGVQAGKITLGRY